MSAKKETPKFSWKVLLWDINARKFRDYDILKFLEEEVKSFKKLANYEDKALFTERMRRRLMWQYWSRAEYECILTKADDGIYAGPWCGGKDETPVLIPEGYLGIDWAKLYEKVGYRHSGCKIDVWDQIESRWEEFIDYVWYYHHKYQRKQVK